MLLILLAILHIQKHKKENPAAQPSSAKPDFLYLITSESNQPKSELCQNYLFYYYPTGPKFTIRTK
jgi:hypothetical protein